MSRYTVEIQLLKQRHYVLEDTLEMIVYRIKEFQIQTLDDDTVASIISSLQRQAKDPNKFPNVIIFLGKDNIPVSIIEFMDQYKKLKVDEKESKKTSKTPSGSKTDLEDD
jgi:hypothetical protein